MQIVPAGVPIPIEFTAYDESVGLFVAMKVYDVTGAPSLVATTPMVHLVNGTYFAAFTPAANHIYVVNKTVYTDGTFSTPLSTYSPGSESFQASTFEADIAAVRATQNPVGGLNLDIVTPQVNAEFEVPQFSLEIEIPEEIL
jgi:hypothetical protein